MSPSRGRRGEAESLIQVFNATTRHVRQRRSEAEQNQNALREQNEAFQAKHQALSKLTVTDPLTQLANRRYLEDKMGREIKRLTRTHQGLSMLVVDIDDFKKLNDSFGHAAGDEFLKQIARILRECVRATDLVARFGGEEFVVLATGTDLEVGHFDGGATGIEVVRHIYRTRGRDRAREANASGDRAAVLDVHHGVPGRVNVRRTGSGGAFL